MMNDIEKQHQELNGKLRVEIKELESIINSQAEEIKRLHEDNENLIKYLEDKINMQEYAEELNDTFYIGQKKAYQEILEKVKSGKYE